ncbi:hypothetical protein AAFF_G00178410 [Aldrovandia affinis]|uniref:Uncharacterized protein n=1 Tax=Aldrovandia affinis TaxID=143900 RepID=A0AAD7RL13_9TELE|nr:hypothetical protein AAFF_G00178410 [Aldrovandia affinis]
MEEQLRGEGACRFCELPEMAVLQLMERLALHENRMGLALVPGLRGHAGRWDGRVDSVIVRWTHRGPVKPPDRRGASVRSRPKLLSAA